MKQHTGRIITKQKKSTFSRVISAFDSSKLSVPLKSPGGFGTDVAEVGVISLHPVHIHDTRPAHGNVNQTPGKIEIIKEQTWNNGGGRGLCSYMVLCNHSSKGLLLFRSWLRGNNHEETWRFNCSAQPMQANVQKSVSEEGNFQPSKVTGAYYTQHWWTSRFIWGMRIYGLIFKVGSKMTCLEVENALALELKHKM